MILVLEVELEQVGLVLVDGFVLVAGDLVEDGEVVGFVGGLFVPEEVEEIENEVEWFVDDFFMDLDLVLLDQGLIVEEIDEDLYLFVGVFDNFLLVLEVEIQVNVFL